MSFLDKTGLEHFWAQCLNKFATKDAIPSVEGLASESYVDNKVASMVDSAPETLNTLNELAAALGDDPNFATTVANQIGTIESEVDGKVSKAGDTMTGALTLPNVRVKNSSSNYPSVHFYATDGAHAGSVEMNTIDGKRYFSFQEIHNDQDTGSGYKTLFLLPNADAGLTANKSYYILTTKSPVTIAQGGTGATTATNALTNLGALPGQSISYTLSTAGWYRIASSAVNINNNIGDFIISGGGSGTHSLISFKASIGSGKYPQIVQLLNTTYSGANQYTKARIVYHTTYSGNYAYLEIYKNGTASSSTKFMYYGAGWTLQAPVAGSIPDGYTSKEFTFIPQTSIATDKSMNIISDASDEVGLKVKNSYGQISFIVHNNRGIYDYVKAGWVLKSVPDSADWYFYGSADSAGILKSSATPTYGLNGLQYFNASLLTSDTADGTISYAPTADWWHILRMNHGNTDGYYVDVGACFHQDYLAYRRVASGTDSGWVRILDEKSGLMKTGGTMTGALSMLGNLYAEGDTLDATQYALDMNNSNIIGANGIYMNDAADGITEGIHFYRSTTTYDSIWAANGKLYFTPNRPLKGAGTAYTVYHTGNKPTASDVGALPLNPASIEMYAGASANHGGFIDFHYNGSTSDHTSRIIESASSVLDINNVSGGKVRLGTVTAGTWNGSAIPVAYGGTGATTAATARTNLGITPANIGAVALQGNSTVNGTITATKVIGAVYA